MRRSEFDRAVADEFGGRSGAVVVDLALGELGGKTAAQALAVGIPPREVWLALCVEAEVPPSHRYGAGRLEPRG